MEFMVKMFDSFDEDYKNHLMQEESNIGRVYRNYILNLEERTDEKDWLISRAANEMINNQLKDKINKKEKQKYNNLILCLLQKL